MNTLPNELLLEIFENLDYWDLSLRVPRICHRFRNLTSSNQGTKIKRLLFSEESPPNDGIVHYTPGLVMNFLWPDLDDFPCPEGFQQIAKRFYLRSRKAKEVRRFDGDIHSAFDLIHYMPGDRLEDIKIRSMSKAKGKVESIPIPHDQKLSHCSIGKMDLSLKGDADRRIYHS